MKRLFIFLLIFISFKSYSQDLYSNYQKQRQTLLDEQSSQEKSVFNKWVKTVTLTKGHAYLACDGWPGPGYACRLHGRQCCYQGCGSKEAAEVKAISASYDTKIEQIDEDYKKASEAVAKKLEEEKIKQEKLEQEKQEKADKEKKEKADKAAKEKAEKEKTGNEKTEKKADTTSTKKTTYVPVESAEDIARRQRIKAAAETDKSENATMGAAAAGVVGMAAFMKDGYSDSFAYLKAQLGLGWEQIPLIGNDANHYKTTVQLTSHPIVYIGLKTGFFNNKGISLHLNPYFTYGLNALASGASGSHTSYGGTGMLLISKSYDSKIKLFAEGGYSQHDGSHTLDLDASAASIGVATTSDVVYESKYKYSTLRYGGGIMLYFLDSGEENETWIRPGVFFEKPSFFLSDTKPLMVGNIQLNLSSSINIDFTYSKNYAIMGTVDYPSNFQKENKSYFCVKVFVQGKLF